MLQRCVFVQGYVFDAGDCDDNNPLVSHFDLDNDGFSSCEGDCDDTEYWTSILSQN